MLAGMVGYADFRLKDWNNCFPLILWKNNVFLAQKVVF
jgi:hypothetical protein